MQKKPHYKRWVIRSSWTGEQKTSISGGAIHAHQYRPYMVGDRDCGDRNYVAYAFGVKAYSVGDLAAAWMYVPAGDKSPHQKARRKVCEAWAKRTRNGDAPSWKEINEHPLFKKSHRRRLQHGRY
jgi:hypothetical protein